MKNKLTDNLILKVLSVVLAILIWIVVLNINDPIKTRTISGIKVEVENDSVITENNQVYTIVEGQIISVKVTGPRTVVDSLRASDFSATADFFDLSQANSVPIEIEINDYEKQQKVTINERSNNTMRLNIEDVIEKNYDVEVRYTGNIAANYVVSDTQIDTKTVKISAPQSILNTIKDVYINVDVTDKSEDFYSMVPVKVVDTNGVDLVQTGNKVVLDVENINTFNTVYYTKNINVSHGSLESAIQNSSIKLSSSELSVSQITVMGKKEDLDRMSDIVLPIEDIVIDGSKSKLTYEYEIEEFLPEGVFLNDTNETITLTVVLDISTKRVLPIEVDEIAIKNIPEGMDASIVSEGIVNITVEGIENLIENLSESDIIAFVSLRNAAQGISQVRVELQLPEGITQISDAYVDVNITSSESGSTQTQTTQTQTVPRETENQSTTNNDQTTSADNSETTTNEETTTVEESDINNNE